jgi:aspartate kinase
MRVFKFGGASVKDANGVRNLASIISESVGNLIIVVSAMDKTTNALEVLNKLYFNQDEKKWAQLNDIKKYHYEVVNELFNTGDDIYAELDADFFRLEDRLHKTPSLDFDFEYDQIVCYGELISTRIVNAYLRKVGIGSVWKDIRSALKTDSKWRDASVDWELSGKLIPNLFDFVESRVFVTQGFIGATKADLSTTLGREGSDFTAAIIASIMNAERVEIWKDVPGIMNADPQFYPNPVKIDFMSYREAVELTFFGAKVIHPKTIKPLHNKNIELHVRSFLKPDMKGTIIGPEPRYVDARRIPIYIMKTHQVLISLSQPDFSFMDEESMSWILDTLHELNVRVNLLQHSALKISFSVDTPERGFMDVIEKLAEQFDVRYNDGLELLTIRYHTPEVIEAELKNKQVYVEQKTRRVARFLIKSN